MTPKGLLVGIADQDSQTAPAKTKIPLLVENISSERYLAEPRSAVNSIQRAPIARY